MAQEIWKEVIDFPGYEVSNYGNVRSIRRKVRSPQGKLVWRKGMDLKPDNVKGYLRVSLQQNNQPKRIFVHRLVATCFLDNIHNLNEINHKDLNKLNNHVENLEWCSRQENYDHSAKHGLRHARTNSSRSKKLTTEMVDEIIYLRKNNTFIKDVAKKN